MNNEPTFVILSLDLSDLYGAVSERSGCVSEALLCCLDTCDAFSPDALCAASRRIREGSKASEDDQWYDKMTTLGASVEERVFKLLPNLVKMEKEAGGNRSERYKEMYRAALTAKMSTKKREKNHDSQGNFLTDPESCYFAVHDVLVKSKK